MLWYQKTCRLYLKCKQSTSACACASMVTLAESEEGCPFEAGAQVRKG